MHAVLSVLYEVKTTSRRRFFGRNKLHFMVLNLKRRGKCGSIFDEFFSAVIICLTIFSLVKALNIAFDRGIITKRKRRFVTAASIFIGIFLAVVLPFGYQKLS